MNLRRAGAVLALALQSCVVVPQTREVYDSQCQVLTKQITLETTVVGRLQGCAGDACLALLVAAGALSAASMVVSGSIALVGNVAYWIERQGRCAR